MLDVEFNIEGYPEPEFLALVHEVQPAQCTLVPDTPEQRTSDHGWDVVADANKLRPVIAALKAEGIRVSLFMDPEPMQMAGVAALGADRVELYTEAYASAFGTDAQARVLRTYVDTAIAAADAGLGINAGHDLTVTNLPEFIARVPHVLEVSIGHALVADALWNGLTTTVQAYRDALR